MRLQGDSFRKIARALNEEGVPSPRGFYYMAESRPNLRDETPYWNDVTVKTILRNEVYLGHIVQNKTGTVFYKVHKQVSKPKEDWIKVEHTHEPLVSQEVWDAVQRLDNHPLQGGVPAAMGKSLYSPASSTVQTAEARCAIRGITAAGSTTLMSILASSKLTPATGI